MALKLELGPVQTLAHKDSSGSWVLNDPPPNKALELAKCQRYFVNLAYPVGGSWIPIGIAIGRSAETADAEIDLPVTMRAKPTVYYSGELSLIPYTSNASDKTVVTSISVNGAGPNHVSLRLTCAGASLVVGASYHVWLSIAPEGTVNSLCSTADL